MLDSGIFSKKNSGAGRSTEDHGTVSSGTEDFSALISNHSYTTAGNHTWTFSNFSAQYPETLIEIEVTGGTPTVTIPATAVIASDSAQTLSAMPVGTYLAWVQRIVEDDTYSYSIFVGQVT